MLTESSSSSSFSLGQKVPRGRPRKRPFDAVNPQWEDRKAAGVPPLKQQQLQQLVVFEPPPPSCSGDAAELRAAAAHTITAASALGVWAVTAKNAAESLAAAIRYSPSLPGEEDVKHAAAACERLAKVLGAASEAGVELSQQADKAMHRAIKLDLADPRTGSASLADQLRSLAGALDSASAPIHPQKPNTQNRGRGRAVGTKKSQQHEVSQPRFLMAPQTLPLPMHGDGQRLRRHRWRFLPAAACKPKAVVGGCARAERLASEILERGDRIRDKDVVSILELWNFRKNTKRKNVLPEGKHFVSSEMLGLTKIRIYNRFVVAANTRKFPLVTKLLCRFLDDNPPKGLEIGTRFPFTTVCINKDYAATRHRDKNNVGMTVLRGLGNYRGGQVKHWPQDPGRRKLPDVAQLAADEAVVIDTKHHSVCMDSTQAHEVMPFSGKRYSLVYFTITRFENTPEDVREFLRDRCDLSIIPNLEEAEFIWQRARESAPGGPPLPTPLPTPVKVAESEEEDVFKEDPQDQPEDQPEDEPEDQPEEDQPEDQFQRPLGKKLWASKSIVID